MFMSMIAAFVVVVSASLQYASCYSHEPSLMTSKSHVDEREHIGEHVEGLMDPSSLNQLSEDELKFLYFKMHDTDDNNMLDGCELLKSLLHWHAEEHKATDPNHAAQGTTRIFQHDELAMMIDPILGSDDINLDGFIDYAEFAAAQKSRGF